MAGKHCNKCGKIKRVVFSCDRCNDKVCLNCFNFVTHQCVDCDIVTYNEAYKAKIEAYEVVI